MRRLTSVLAVALALSFGAATVYAGPGCGSKKANANPAKLTKAGCSASRTASVASEFPTMVRMVGDEAIGCPHAAKQLAEKNGAKIRFVVGSERFDSEIEAWRAGLFYRARTRVSRRTPSSGSDSSTSARKRLASKA